MVPIFFKTNSFEDVVGRSVSSWSRENNENLGFSFSVDEERFQKIKQLKWKFRGNVRIELLKEKRGNAVLMFRFEEENKEQI